MPIVAPFQDGFRRVLSTPLVLLGTWLLTVAVALPLGLLLRGELQVAFGETLASGVATDSIAWDWWQQFAGHTSGTGRLFIPPIVVAATLLSDLNRLVTGDGLALIVGTITTIYLVAWTFLAGGILDRYARNRPTRSAGFFSACGVHVTRLLRLTLLTGLAYAVLLGVAFNWLFDGVNAGEFSPTTEGRSFAIQSLTSLVFGALLAGVNLVFDYARVRTVVEDRRSMVGAVVAAWRFVRRHPVACSGLYAVNCVVLVSTIALYTIAAPNTGPTWLIFLIGQAYLMARLVIMLLFWASEISYFQSQLAHAGYVASPQPVWPESPTAEALSRLK